MTEDEESKFLKEYIKEMSSFYKQVSQPYSIINETEGIMTETNKYAFAMECVCDNPAHMLICEIFPEGPNDKEWDALVYFTGNFRAPWFIRIIYAFLFIFKPNPYMVGNVVHLNEKNTETLINIGKSLEEIK